MARYIQKISLEIPFRLKLLMIRLNTDLLLDDHFNFKQRICKRLMKFLHHFYHQALSILLSKVDACLLKFIWQCYILFLKMALIILSRLLLLYLETSIKYQIVRYKWWLKLINYLKSKEEQFTFQLKYQTKNHFWFFRKVSRHSLIS